MVKAKEISFSCLTGVVLVLSYPQYRIARLTVSTTRKGLTMTTTNRLPKPSTNGSTAAKKPSKKQVQQAAKVADDTLASRIAVATAVSTVVLSQALNVYGFTHNSPGIAWTVCGALLGLVLPLWILALTFLAHHMSHRSPWLAAGAVALAVCLLIVSLPHLASGFMAMGTTMVEAWCLAVMADLTQVVCKLCVVRMWRE